MADISITGLKRKRSSGAKAEGKAESSAQAIAREEKLQVQDEEGDEEQDDEMDANDDLEDADEESEVGTSEPSRKQSKPLPLLAKKKKNAPSPGIVYISRLPPGMTPQKVKHLMSQWGEIGKVYAQRPQQSELSSSKSTPRHSKHQQANFTEAWVEFLDKKYAKVAAEVLNAQVIGGKKGDKWRDDIWTMRYLSGFRWEMLGEQVAHERQAHSSRLRQELSKSRLEQSEYLRNVELARVLEKRRVKRGDAAGAAGAGAKSDKIVTEAGAGKGQRGYRQREIAGKPSSKGGAGLGQGGKGGAKAGGAPGAAGGDAMAGVLAGLF